MTTSSRCRLRSRLLTTCALALTATPLAAQTYNDRALQGDLTVVSGTVGIGRTPTKDTVTISTPQAIINWNPETGTAGVLPASPAPINFLPSGREAVFQGAAIGQDFVVLNRILPSTNRAISINGTVTSQIVTGVTTGSPPVTTYARGGSVWFYSPGGIIAGPTSVFNVGNLILTANDIDATGGLFAPGGAIRFDGPANSTSAVTVQAGAQVNLTRAGSYFALVAPQVTMGGTATVNGSAAYIAAEQVDVTVNSGLFDMNFRAGTTVANALTHTGTTTGPAQTTGSITLASFPKNTAITMLVSGSLGYTPAATATVQNGTVVLSSGYILGGGSAVSTVSDQTGGNIVIGNTNFTSSVFGSATGSLTASPTTPGALTFSSDATLAANVLAILGADSGESVSVAGNLSLTSSAADATGTARLYSTITPSSALAAPTVTVAGTTTVGGDRRGLSAEDGTSATGATAQIVVTGGSMTFNDLIVTALGIGGDSSTGPLGGSGTGGNAALIINGGTVTVNGALTVRADGIGGGSGTTSGSGTGGTASVALNAGATPTVFNLNGLGNRITATGAVNEQFPAINGGNGTGGNALLTVNSGALTSIELFLDAYATGGNATSGTAGISSAGTARISIAGGRYDTNSLFLNADERQAPSDTGTSGSTTGSGLAAVDVTGTGILNVGVSGGNSMSLSANAILGGARFGTPAIGGTLVAGTARLTATAGGTIFTDATAPSAPKPPVLLTASVLYDQSDPALPSATQRGGNVSVIADGGTMSLHKLDMRANAIVRQFANAAGDAGPSFGGTAALSARNGGTLTVRTGSGATPVAAYATGGTITAPLLGTGGTIDIAAQGGTLALPDGLTVDARGFGGNNQGGTGGTIAIRSLAGSGAQAASFTAGATTIDASGQISAGLPNGTGGAINVSNVGQTMTFANLFARAGAANGTPSGSITLTADNAPIVTTANFTGMDLGTLGTLTLNASGPLGSIVGSTGIFGFGNDILISHTGVAPAAATTLTGPSISLIAGRDQIHTGSVTLRTGAATLVGRRTLGGGDSTVSSTGDIRLGSGLLATSNGVLFRTLDAAGAIGGYQGASSTTPEITTPGSFTIGERAFAGVGSIDIRAGTGIDIADAGTSSTGQVLLSSTTGDVRLGTSGVALATRPDRIIMTATAGRVIFTNLFATSSIFGTGQTGILGGNGSASGVNLASGGGSIITGNFTANGLTMTAANSIAAGTISTGIFGTLTATTGSVEAASISGSQITVNGTTGVTVPIVTGGVVTLNAVNGPVRVATNLSAVGPINISGRDIFLRSTGALTVNSLNATAGNLDVASAGALSITTPQATGSVTLASSGSNVTFGAAVAGTSFAATAAGTATGNSVTATTGPVTMTGANGITVPVIISGGTTTLSAVNGAISVATNFQSAGLVTANGRSVVLRATGPLTANTLNASAGALDVSSGGALGVTTAQASSSASLVSTGGNVALGSTTAGTALTATATGTVTGTSAISTGGTVGITGPAGIDIPTVSGSTVTLNAVNGTVRVATDLRTGNPIVNGQSLFLRAVGQLGIGTLTATGAGGIDAAAGGSIQMTSISAANGPVRLTAGGALLNVPGALLSGGATILNAPNGAVSIGALQSLGVLSAAGRSVGIAATGPIVASALTATAGPATLQVTNGALSVGTTTATGAITLSSSNSSVGFGTVQAGGNTLLTAGTSITGTSVVSGGFASLRGNGNLTAQTIQATDFIQLRSSPTTATIAVGTANAGTYLEARGAALNFGNVTAGTDVLLSSFNGGLTVGDVTAGDDIFLTVNGSNANPATVSPDSQTGVVSTTQFALTAGNLRSTGLGSDTAASGPQTFGTGAGPAGNVVRVRASGAVQTGSIDTGGSAIVTSDLSTIQTQAIRGTAGVGLYVRGNVTTGDITTGGTFWLGDSSQLFAYVPSYTVTNFAPFQTPTSGGATLGVVRADLIRGSVLTNTGYASMTAASDLLWTSGNSTTIGGSMTGGALSTGTSLSLRIGGSISFTTATAGTSAFVNASTGNIAGTSVLGGDSVDAVSRTGLTLTSATSTTGNVTLGTLANELRVATVTAGGDVIVGATDNGTSSANVILGTVTSGGGTRIEGGNTVPGTVATGAITAGGAIDIGATSVTTADLTSGGNTTLATFGGALTTGNVSAINLFANSAGGLTMGRVTAVEDIRLSGGTDPALMVTGDLTAGDDIIATGNAITTGNLLTTGLGPDNEDDGSAIDLQLNRIAAGTANSAGRILYAASQPITFTSTTSRFGTIIRSFGPITGGNSTAGTTLDIQGGSINTANGQAGGALNYVNFDPADTIRTGTLTGATVTASSRGTLTTGAVNAIGAVNLFGDQGASVASAISSSDAIQLFAQTSGPVTSGALRAAGNVTVRAQTGAVTLTTLDAGGPILLRAGGGALNFTRATATGLVGMSATGNIAFGTVQAGGTFQAQTPGTITGTSATSSGGAPNIVQGDAGVTIPTLITNGATVLSAVNGAVNVATDLRSTAPVTATARSVTLRSTGALNLADVAATAGGIDVNATGSLTLGTVRASGDIVVTSALDLAVATTLEAGFVFAQQPGVASGSATLTGRNITINGSALAQTFLTAVATGTVAINGNSTTGRFGTEISSSDIIISTGGVLGRIGSRLSLTNSGAAQTVVGDVTGTGSWRLDASEISRIRASNVTITAPVVGGPASTAFNSARTPDVLVGSFAAAVGTQLGGEGTFAIQTAGKVRVTGAVSFTNMGPDATVAIRGDEAIEVLDAGSIVLNGQAGLSGTLDLTSRNIVASSSAALADFAAAADLKAISDRAGKNDGTVNDGGYLQAGGIRATLLNSTLIIQNTGAATTTANRDYSGRRGFTVGAGGFTIIQGGSNPVRIAINGRQTGTTTPLGAPTTGGFVTGLDLIPLIKIRGIDTATNDIFQVPPSGVLTAAQLAAAPRLFDTTSTVNGCAITSGSACRVVPNDPIRDILNEDFGEDAVANLLPLTLVQLKDYVTPGDEPLIDEPVTGAGNDDLWSVDDTKPKCDPAKEACEAPR